MTNSLALKNQSEHLPIRSFVLRQGRMTVAQKRAFQDFWLRYGLEPLGTPRDFTSVFGRSAPLVLEIGFGNGEALSYASQQEPNKNFIGIEVHRPGVGRLLNALGKNDLSNARIFHEDAVEILTHEIAPNTLDQVRIYFPDPWPKQRHHKRRLIQSELIALIASRMQSGGILHLATDWEHYAQHMLALLDSAVGWRNRAGAAQFSARPSWRIETHFEKRGLRLGHGVWDLIYERF